MLWQFKGFKRHRRCILSALIIIQTNFLIIFVTAKKVICLFCVKLFLSTFLNDLVGAGIKRPEAKLKGFTGNHLYSQQNQLHSGLKLYWTLFVCEKKREKKENRCRFLSFGMFKVIRLAVYTYKSHRQNWPILGHSWPFVVMYNFDRCFVGLASVSSLWL